MAKKPKAHPEDSAKAVFRISMKKPQDVVIATSRLTDTIKTHPHYSTKPEMQQAVTTVTGITDTLAKQDTDIQTARTGLISLLSARALTMHAFTRARRSLLAVADEIAAGSAAPLNECGVGAFTTQTPLATPD